LKDKKAFLFNLSSSINQQFHLSMLDAIELIKFDLSELNISESSIYFKSNNSDIICIRKYIGEFYDEYMSHFDITGTTLIIDDSIIHVIKSIKDIFENQNIDQTVDIQLTQNNSYISVHTDTVQLQKKISTQLSLAKKDKINFSINPVFFSQILEKTNKMIISEDRALFECDNFKHVLSLG
jgi:hypothetical protein